MRMRTKYTICLALAGVVAAPGPAEGQALSRPEGWTTRVERFVAMPPGFHITTSSSVLLYHPQARAEGEYEVTTNGFLFRGDSPSSYGLFIGGRSLESDDAVWTSLEIARDGTWVVRERRDAGPERGYVVEEVVGPEPGPVAVPGDEVNARNELAVAAGPEDVAFRVNGETVTVLPRADLAVDGVAGFRVGSDLNLHLATLSITKDGETEQWAPAPAEQPEGGGR